VKSLFQTLSGAMVSKATAQNAASICPTKILWMTGFPSVAVANRPEVKWHCLVLRVFWAHASGQMTSTVKTPHRNSHGKDQNMSPSSRNLK